MLSDGPHGSRLKLGIIFRSTTPVIGGLTTADGEKQINEDEARKTWMA
jgi:hypothetical protein